jgi:hypothetical protein
VRQAADRWPEVGPALLALLEAAAEGTDRSDRTAAIMFFGIYLMAQAREARPYRPLCVLGADGEHMVEVRIPVIVISQSGRS